MNKLLQGVHKFQQEIFGLHKKLFKRLAKRQAPHTLFITCSDSRISPSMLTQTEPGEIFILRNAGNIIPPHSEAPNGEAATIEFAILGLGIENIVVCGHSYCGAMKAVLEPHLCSDLPSLRAWLKHASFNEAELNDRQFSNEEEKINHIVKENILKQIDNLKTHPSVNKALLNSSLKLYGWVYIISTGEVLNYDFNLHRFRPLGQASRVMTHADHDADDNKLQI